MDIAMPSMERTRAVVADDERSVDCAPLDAPMQAAEICVIIPTYNEASNLASVFARIREALSGLAWEVIVVDDDSPDGTAQRVREFHASDPRFRAIQRIGRRGLSSACIEGMLATSAPVIAVMDGDLQHDPDVLRTMWALLVNDSADVVVATRYAKGGSVGDWDSSRARLSRLATHITRRIASVRISDPMSGFFAMRRSVLAERVHRLSGIGFKILLDILLTAPGHLRVVETPYVFAPRKVGASKFSTRSAWELGILLAEKTVLGRCLPVRFLAFCCVGGLGVLVHLAVLALLYRSLGVGFVTAQAVAAAAAILSNYTINNALTYIDATRRGLNWFTGLFSFAAICSLGALLNIWVSNLVLRNGAPWLLAAVAGVAIAAMWNYAISAHLTWRSGRAKSSTGAQ